MNLGGHIQILASSLSILSFTGHALDVLSKSAPDPGQAGVIAKPKVIQTLCHHL